MDCFVVYTDKKRNASVFKFDIEVQAVDFIKDKLEKYSQTELADFQVIYGLSLKVTEKMVKKT